MERISFGCNLDQAHIPAEYQQRTSTPAYGHEDHCFEPGMPVDELALVLDTQLAFGTSTRLLYRSLSGSKARFRSDSPS